MSTAAVSLSFSQVGYLKALPNDAGLQDTFKNTLNESINQKKKFVFELTLKRELKALGPMSIEEEGELADCFRNSSPESVLAKVLQIVTRSGVSKSSASTVSQGTSNNQGMVSSASNASQGTASSKGDNPLGLSEELLELSRNQVGVRFETYAGSLKSYKDALQIHVGNKWPVWSAENKAIQEQFQEVQRDFQRAVEQKDQLEKAFCESGLVLESQREQLQRLQGQLDSARNAATSSAAAATTKKSEYEEAGKQVLQAENDCKKRDEEKAKVETEQSSASRNPFYLGWNLVERGGNAAIDSLNYRAGTAVAHFSEGTLTRLSKEVDAATTAHRRASVAWDESQRTRDTKKGEFDAAQSAYDSALEVSQKSQTEYEQQHQALEVAQSRVDAFRVQVQYFQIKMVASDLKLKNLNMLREILKNTK